MKLSISLYFTRQAENIIALTASDSKQQLMFLSSLCPTVAENDTCNNLCKMLCIYESLFMSGLLLSSLVFECMNSLHPPQVSTCLPSYFPSYAYYYSYRSFHGNKVFLHYMHMDAAFMFSIRSPHLQI